MNEDKIPLSETVTQPRITPNMLASSQRMDNTTLPMNGIIAKTRARALKKLSNPADYLPVK